MLVVERTYTVLSSYSGKLIIVGSSSLLMVKMCLCTCPNLLVYYVKIKNELNDTVAITWRADEVVKTNSDNFNF